MGRKDMETKADIAEQKLAAMLFAGARLLEKPVYGGFNSSRCFTNFLVGGKIKSVDLYETTPKAIEQFVTDILVPALETARKGPQNTTAITKTYNRFTNIIKADGNAKLIAANLSENVKDMFELARADLTSVTACTENLQNGLAVLQKTTLKEFAEARQASLNKNRAPRLEEMGVVNNIQAAINENSQAKEAIERMPFDLNKPDDLAAGGNRR